MTFFHYKAGAYEVTLDDPADFGTFSETLITSTSIKGIDINISAPTFFPPLAGGPVSFHADFAAVSSPPIFSSDALPTNTALGPGSFVDSNVTLLPPSGVVTSSNLTSLTLTAVAPGDYNNNGLIDAADYVVWRQTLGQTAPGSPLMATATTWSTKPTTKSGVPISAKLPAAERVLPHWPPSPNQPAHYYSSSVELQRGRRARRITSRTPSTHRTLINRPM